MSSKRNLTLLAVLFLTTTLAAGAQATRPDRNTEMLRFKESYDRYRFCLKTYERYKTLQEAKLVSDADTENRRLETDLTLSSLKEAAYNLIRANQTVVIQEALKTVGPDGSAYVKLRLLNTSREKDFPEDLDKVEGLRKTWTSWLNVNNLHVSLLDQRLNIGNPYEAVQSIPEGQVVECRFQLLKDVPELTVRMTYNGQTTEDIILLAQDTSKPQIVLKAEPYSQAVAYGSSGDYKIHAEGYGFFEKIIRLGVEGLPADIRYEFLEGTGNTVLRNIKLTRAQPSRDLILRVYMPEASEAGGERPPLSCRVTALIPDEKGAEVESGKVGIELIPKGTASIKLSFPNMYYEVHRDELVRISAKLTNEGTIDLINPRLDVSLPSEWELVGIDGLEKRIGSKQVNTAAIVVRSMKDAPTGDYEIRIKCTADNISAQAGPEEKLIRVTLSTRGKVWIALLALALLIGGSYLAFRYVRRSTLR